MFVVGNKAAEAKAGKNAFPIHFLFSPKIPVYWGIAR
jgi:hypothetical protein